MVVLVARETQTMTLNPVSRETGRYVVVDSVKCVEHGPHIMPGQIGHQPRQRRIVMLVEDRADPRVSIEIALEMLAPPLAALIDQSGVQRVRASVDPLAQLLA